MDKIKQILKNINQMINDAFKALEVELEEMTPEERAMWYSRFYNYNYPYGLL